MLHCSENAIAYLNYQLLLKFIQMGYTGAATFTEKVKTILELSMANGKLALVKKLQN